MVAFFLGLLVVRGPLAYLESHTLRLLVWYRIALGLAVMTAVASGAL